MDGTILVTGGTGKTARALLPLLREAGARVRAGSRTPQAAGGVEPVRFDWYDEATWDALDGADRVYLVPPAFDATPHPVMVPFLERARAAGVRRAVMLSAMGVELTGEASLATVEQAAGELLTEATVLRPTWFMQNFDQGFIQPTIAAQDALLVPAGDAAISFVDVRDIAAVAAAVLLGEGHAGATYTLTGPEALTHDQAAAHISDVVGRTVRYVPISDDDFRVALTSNGVPAEYADLLVGLFGAARAGLSSQVSGDVERVAGRPPRSFAAFARDAADAWRSVAAPAEAKQGAT